MLRLRWYSHDFYVLYKLPLALVSLTTLAIIFKLSSKEKRIPLVFSNFRELSPQDNGVLPSNLDIQYETFKPGDALYFFAFDKKNSFQLTLKEKTNGCFFVIKIKIQEEIFENCGFLDKELDGSYRF